VDIDLPGNAELPVTLGRTFAIENKYGMKSLVGFGDWDVDVPYLEGFFSGTGWVVANEPSPNRYKRCSIQTVPAIGNSSFDVEEVWGGYMVHIPGGEDGPFDKAAASDTFPDPADGNAYPWITPAQSRLRCITSTANGYPGEGFVLKTASGLTY